MPEGTQPTTPPTTPAPAPAAATPPSTRVTVGGRSFELRNMSVEDGTALYNALSPEQRARADQMATVIQLFHSLVEVHLPPHLSANPIEAFRQYTRALEAGGGYLGANAEPWMRDFGRAIDPFLRNAPGYDAAAGALENTRNAMSVFEGITSAPGYVLGLPMRIWEALGVTAREGGDAIESAFSRRSIEQARAVAAAYVALEEEERARRPAPTLMSLGGIIPGLQAALDMAYNNNFLYLPQVIFTAINFCSEFFGQWGRTNQMPDILATWNASWARVGGEIEQSRTENGSDWNSLFNRRAQASADPTTIIGRMTAAGSIAGVPTQEIAPLLARGGVYQANDGSVHAVAPEGQDDTARPNPETGQPDTRGARVGNAWGDVIAPGNQATNTGGALLTGNIALSMARRYGVVPQATATTVVRGAARGVLRRVAAPAMALWEGGSAVTAYNEGDTRGVVTHGTQAATAAVGTACLFFGPIGWVVGGVLLVADATGATEAVSGAIYDQFAPSPQPGQPTTTTTTSTADGRPIQVDAGAAEAAYLQEQIRAARPFQSASVQFGGTYPAPAAPGGAPAPAPQGQLSNLFGIFA